MPVKLAASPLSPIGAPARIAFIVFAQRVGLTVFRPVKTGRASRARGQNGSMKGLLSFSVSEQD